ncbi:Curlin associated repeat-containing protein [Bacteroides luti]|uniref:Curlin associated repeat-containing protein n=1 Tax=Bacteroides luti TaxID=1297750 RepID=A0A1M4Y3E0_9BACE|nr:hypothetical protein [Bacteroides luti]SHF00271.1 Curlin associated repeat-containing protein [Bacteroides luti]
MKKATFYLILLLINYFPCNSQEIINNSGLDPNEVIRQIQTSGIDNIMNFQALNQGYSNYALIQQTGNENKSSISQQNDVASAMNNQSYAVQTGTSNELTVGQVGTGNLLLSFQLGYLASLAESQQENQIGVDYSNISALLQNAENGSQIEGKGNKLSISQEGNNNNAKVVQQGFYNTITAEQKGKNNYLSALQNGTKNSVTDYKQGNESEQILFDTIIQIGDNLSLTTDGVANSTPAVNKFTQTGTNLSLQLSTSLLNTGAGVEINQTGHDMKVFVDQSYFSFPLRKQ